MTVKQLNNSITSNKKKQESLKNEISKVRERGKELQSLLKTAKTDSKKTKK